MKWLADAVESALAQAIPSKQVIVVDDGSTDGSLDLARTFLKRGVEVISQDNRGAAAARNRGLVHAAGDFVQFLDADDVLEAEKISRQIEVLEAFPRPSLAGAAWGHFRNSAADAIFNREAVYGARTGVEFLQLHYECSSMMQPAAWLTPRELIDRAGPWNESLSLNDDGEYFARVMLNATNVVFVPSARVFYRIPAKTNLSRRRDPKAMQSLFSSVELMTRYLGDSDRSPRTRSAIAHAWKWTAYELYPEAPDLAKRAEANSLATGGSRRPLPVTRAFSRVAAIFGWRFACHLQALVRSMRPPQS